MRSSSKKGKMLFFLILIGAIGGTLLGDILGNKIVFLDFLKYSYTIGTPKNLFVDLKVINFTIGINFKVNFMTIIGIILSIIVYRKYNF